MRIFLHKAIRDIRFVLLILFVIRFFGLFNPPLEVAHNWRQTDMMMVARNLAEDPSGIFYPRVDYEGVGKGIVGMEFPIVNELIAMCINTFGFTHWYGRLINLLLSSIGLYFFYLILLKLFDKRYAYTATFILAASVWFAYTRKILPDTIAVSFLFAGIYCSLLYLEKHKKRILYLLLSIILIALGGLIKISSFVVMAFLLPAILDKNIALKQKIILALGYSISLSVIVYWYFIWVPYLNSLSSIRFFMGNSLSTGFYEILNDLPRTLNRFYETAIGFTGIAMLFTGLFFSIKNKNRKILVIFFSGFAMQLLLLLKVGNHFGMHTYYILTLVPLMAFLAANAIQKVPVTYLIIIGFIFWAENFSRYFDEFMIKPTFQPVEELSTLLDNLGVEKNDLIAVNGNGSPTILYFSERKGLLCQNEDIKKKEYISRLKRLGCDYIVISKIYSNYPKPQGIYKIHEDDTFCVFKIE